MKYAVNVYGRAWLHDYVKAKAAQRKERDPNHSISQEYDELIVAGARAKYGDELSLLKPQAQEAKADDGK